MGAELKSFGEVVREISDQFGLEPEVVESILVEWHRVMFVSLTGREPDGTHPLLDA